MSQFYFNIFTGISFRRDAFLELRFWISVLNFFLSTYLKENLLLFVSIRFWILVILGCVEIFSMHAKTGLFWLVLERCVSSLCIFKFLTIELKKFWKFFTISVSLEMISSFSTSVVFSLYLIFYLKKGARFFSNIFIVLILCNLGCFSTLFKVDIFKSGSFYNSFSRFLCHKTCMICSEIFLL